MGNSKFITNSLIFSSSILQDPIIKFKEYSSSLFFFSKMWENLHPQKSYPSSCVHYFMVSKRATLTHCMCSCSSKWEVYIFNISTKQFGNLTLNMPRHCCTYSTRASHKQQCKKKHTEIWTNQLTRASSKTSEQEL